MVLINNLKFSLNTDFDNLKSETEKILKHRFENVVLYRKSVDARDKSNVHFCCSVIAECKNEMNFIKKNKNVQKFDKKEYVWKKSKYTDIKSPIVVGFGPCGMFCALALARAGLKPIIIERGYDVDTRTEDVEKFFNGEAFNPESNVQFGEGGAGTFSDGKLNTGIKDYRCRAVLKEFVSHGADEKILTDAKPHIGTDVLINVVKNIRKEIISLGGKILFGTKMEKIITSDNKIVSVIANGKEFFCDSLVVATGHSARDVFKTLKDMDVAMERKPFSVGVRIEHLQEDINKALYGEFYNHPALSAAEYKLSVHLDNGRGVYTFCMCPGGEVINSSSENGGIAVNGMSCSLRNGKNANSALLVGILPEDFSGEDVLAGCEFQRDMEQKAFNCANGNVPVTTVGQLCFNENFELKGVVPTVKPNFAFCDFAEIFPNYILSSIKTAIAEFDKKIKGFADKSAVLTAPETRSSSPVRVLRNGEYQSLTYSGLYPAGEGAGYAGGIMSAAVDGIRIAEFIIDNPKKTCNNSL